MQLISLRSQKKKSKEAAGTIPLTETKSEGEGRAHTATRTEIWGVGICRGPLGKSKASRVKVGIFLIR